MFCRLFPAGTPLACALVGTRRPRRIGELAWAAAKLARDTYINDPSTDFHEMTAAIAGIKRKQAKSLGLGKIYGMGGLKLCRELGLPTQMIEKRIFDRDKREWKTIKDVFVEAPGPEALRIIAAFDTKVPFASKMLRADSDQAEELGFIRTASGRRGRFEMSAEGKYLWTHKALNKRILGSAADQTKEACCQLDAAGIYLQIQIYDETDSSIASRAQAFQIREIMENCTRMVVPSKVDLEIGPNWGQAKEAA